MSLFTRPAETRDIDASDVWGPMAEHLRSVKPTRLVPVYGAVRLIADQWAQGSMTVTEAKSGEHEPVETPLILSDPDPILDLFDWKVQLVTALQFAGNAYGLVDDGRRYCRWLPDDWVTIDESNPLNPQYRVLGKPMDLVKQGGNLLHVRNMVRPGSAKGISPLEHFASTFEWAGMAREYGRRWFRNSSIPPAILQAKASRVDANMLREARDEFVEAAKSGLPVALPGEWAYSRISISPQEAQFLETIQATATDVAVIYGVPPEKIGGRAGSSRTYSNVESDQRLFRVETLGGVTGRAMGALAALLRPGQELTYELSVLEQPGILELARHTTEELRNGSLTLAEARRRFRRRGLTDAEIEQWQQWYAINKSESESDATSRVEMPQGGMQ
ncbi:phage portal protein [Microbacterium arborescens]